MSTHTVHDVIDHPSKVKTIADYDAFVSFLKTGAVVGAAPGDAARPVIEAQTGDDQADEGMSGRSLFLYRQNHAGAAPPHRASGDGVVRGAGPNEGGASGAGNRLPDAEAVAEFGGRALMLYRESHGGENPPAPVDDEEEPTSPEAIFRYRMNNRGEHPSQTSGDRGRR